ncbi:MAG: hypothetical protein ACLR94_17170 [Acutalibacteraceae bacterium]
MENEKTAMGDLSLEQVKTEAKKRFNKDITDEQAQAILENHCSEELSAQALEEVTGGRDRSGDLHIRVISPILPEPIIDIYDIYEKLEEERLLKIRKKQIHSQTGENSNGEQENGDGRPFFRAGKDRG